MAIVKGDFIEIEFTGKIKETGEIFDTTDQEIAKKVNLNVKGLKPFTFSVGHKMLPNGFDSDIVGKEVLKSYVLNLTPENAFGKREKSLVKMIPTKLFLEQRINPQRGMQLNLDGQIVRVLSNSGGRTLVDFNNPLAGKDIVYEYKINKVVTDDKEKVDALCEFLFRQKFNFEMKDGKIIFDVDKNLEPIVQMFSPKFKEILGKEVLVKNQKEEKNGVKK